MRRHLWVLDLALLAGVFLAGLVLKDRWSEMSKREETLLKQVVGLPRLRRCRRYLRLLRSQLRPIWMRCR